MSATPSPGRTVTAGAVITNFIFDERPRFGDREGSILGSAAQQLAELVGYLEVTANEYEEACATFFATRERLNKLSEAITERAGASPRAVPPEEQALMDEVGVASLKIYLRIETFYVFREDSPRQARPAHSPLLRPGQGHQPQ